MLTASHLPDRFLSPHQAEASNLVITVTPLSIPFHPYFTTNDILGFPIAIILLKMQTLKEPYKYSSPKTACVLSSYSYQITIKELMIMLPLHGQNTAALQQTSVGRPYFNI